MTTKEKIKKFNECGISQSKIADMAQISKSTLCKWMNGDRENISEETQSAIEVALANIADTLNSVVYGETESNFKYDDIVLD